MSIDGQLFTYPESPDRFYAIVGGRLQVPIIYEDQHAIAFEDGSDDDTTRVTIIPRDPISSVASLDFSDAIRWLGMLSAIRAVPGHFGWGPHEGFRIDTPVHPPYQRQAWLSMHLSRSKSKVLKGEADEHGYTRDIGHFAEIVELHRRVEVLYANDEFMVFHDFEDEDNAEYEHVLVGIPRRQVTTIMDDDYTPQDWLSLIGGIRETATRLNIPAYTTYMNVRPPYQHTAWVHVHLLAGGKALEGDAKKKDHKDKDHKDKGKDHKGAAPDAT
jgi:diadenosine tetraphosphate (Ap4A) HIT family hydrolase